MINNQLCGANTRVLDRQIKSFTDIKYEYHKTCNNIQYSCSKFYITNLFSQNAFINFCQILLPLSFICSQPVITIDKHV